MGRSPMTNQTPISKKHTNHKQTQTHPSLKHTNTLLRGALPQLNPNLNLAP